MSPRIVLGAAPSAALGTRADGSPLVGPNLPRELGGVPVWSDVAELSIGTRAAWEFRHPLFGRCLVIQTIGDTADGRHLFVAWVPANERDGLNPVFEQLAPVLASLGILSAYWPCTDVGGALVPELDASPEADAVRAAWPASWRVRMPNDAPGDPFATPPVPPAAPTGPLMIGEVLA